MMHALDDTGEDISSFGFLQSLSLPNVVEQFAVWKVLHDNDELRFALKTCVTRE